ncbi:lipopolysaccharide biosynthesis protein [Vibrio sp. 1731]|uniref:lipopolysaccharide biosynthesis protein n=1 Tax=Vibrio sp. 1731 TaxID=3074573 RepID=UPI0021D18AA2|nr:lipopolysaccharide biosynthesis protein [Vibrio sp. 1731]MDW2113373.1 lipopolysaccharide biosynthesis protein [Vibrio sp. 1731]
MGSKSFDDDISTDTLKSKTVSGGIITSISQALKLTLQISSNIILARLLTPEDFGLVAMVSVVATFIIMFKDLGLSQATIQSKSITHAQVSTLFWVNVVFGLAFMVLTIIISPFVASFYQQPELRNITILLAIGIFVGGLTVQHQAIMRRKMMYKEIAIIDILSMVSGITVAIITALLGFGYWALVLLQLTQALVLMIGVWYFSRWLPGKPEKLKNINSMLAFGGYMSMYSFVNYFARNLDTILIGWKWGAVPVGLYSRAYSLLLLPIGQLTAPFSSIAVPALSRLQESPKEFNNFYLKMVRVIAYLSMPLIIVMSILSYEIVIFLLGEEWEEAARIFQLLSFAAFWQPIASTVGWIYVSLGKVKRMMKWGFIGTGVMATFMYLGLEGGAEGVAYYYSVSMWVLIIPIFLYAFHGTALTLKMLGKSIALPVANAILVGISFYVAKSICMYEGVFTSILWTIIIGSSLYGTSLIIFKPIRDDIKTVLQQIKRNR